MKTSKDLTQDLELFIGLLASSSIDDIVVNLQYQITQLQQKAIGIEDDIYKTLVNLSGSFDYLINNLSSEQVRVLAVLGHEKFVGANRHNQYEILGGLMYSEPSRVGAELNEFVSEVKQFLHNVRDYASKSFRIIGESDEIFFYDPNTVRIEIIFNGNVSIDDFADAKTQMNEWFIIIAGYAQVFGISPADFEIESIEKKSPARFWIVTSLTIATGLVALAKEVISFQTAQIQYETATKESAKYAAGIETKQYEEIQRILANNFKKMEEEKMENFVRRVAGHNADQAVIQAGANAMSHQLKFIVNGGSVNFYTIDAGLQNDIQVLKAAEDTVKLLSNSLDVDKRLDPAKDTLK